MTETIPGPAGLPFVGNAFDVGSDEGYVKSAERLAEMYGPVYQMTLQGQKWIVISSAELLLDILDEKTWLTIPSDELAHGEDTRGLFNAHISDPDWGQARRVLAPSFGQLAIESMFEGMRDVANQMCMKWARMGHGHQVLLTDDFTRLTLDVIALTTMDFRFNSFYQEQLHPFIEAMVTYLKSGTELMGQPSFINKLFSRSITEKAKAKKLLNEVAQGIIDTRRQNPKPGQDLLNTMIFNQDPKTGKVMRDQLIIENMVAFLIAGHETTSGLLSFAVEQLIRNPHMYLRARQEVDDVVGTRRIEPQDLKKMKYLNAVLRETLRVTPAVPSLVRTIQPSRRNDYITIGGGKYHVPPEANVEILLTKAHIDPSYFGPDAHEFDPERMMDDNPRFADFIKAWKPFGHGSKSCIGQSFAWLEATLALAMVLQNFDLNFSDPAYQMRVVELLTIKPDNLYVKVRLREGVTPASLEKRLYASHGTEPDASPSTGNELLNTDASAEPDLALLFGSNTGTCQSLAQKLASKIASAFSINVVVKDLDSVVDAMLKCPVVIITATYEGQPADNAGRFVAWLEGLKSGSLQGTKYTVFGLGDKNWHSTFHRIPRLIDTQLEAKGAERIAPLGAVDVSEANIVDELEAWYETNLQKTMQTTLGLTPTNPSAHTQDADAEISTTQRATSISNGMVLGKVIDTKTLTQPGQPDKRHIEIQLPQGTTYECGDYLAILPHNSRDLVRRIMAHWDYPRDATIVLKSDKFAPLLTDVPLSISDILAGYYELSQPPSKTTLHTCISYTQDEATIQALQAMISASASGAPASNQIPQSLFDVLQVHPKIKLPFSVYLSTLIPLRPRQYSISSSPLVHRTSCTLTYGVLRSGGQESSYPAFEGVASNFLAGLHRNDIIQVSVRRTASANKTVPFRLPADMHHTPMLMIGAGTGIAPFRGFIQHRASILEASPTPGLAPAVMFMGCRSATGDRLYASEFEQFASLGAVDTRYAFSQEPEQSENCAYISDRLWHDRATIIDLWERGARVYVCGSRDVLRSVHQVFDRIIEEVVRSEGGNVEQESKEFWANEWGQRAVHDVFD